MIIKYGKINPERKGKYEINPAKVLLNYLMIISLLYLRLHAKQFIEKEFQVC